MGYFVTAASGFIGKRLVRRLQACRGSVEHFRIRHRWRADHSNADPPRLV